MQPPLPLAPIIGGAVGGAAFILIIFVAIHRRGRKGGAKKPIKPRGGGGGKQAGVRKGNTASLAARYEMTTGANKTNKGANKKDKKKEKTKQKNGEQRAASASPASSKPQMQKQLSTRKQGASAEFDADALAMGVIGGGAARTTNKLTSNGRGGGADRDGASWTAAMDMESGDTYYYNKKTGKTTWDKPY